MSADQQLSSLLEMAEKSIQKKQWNQAINYAMRAVSLSTNCIEAYLLLGRAYAKRREYDGAYAAFKRALQIDPDNVPACRNLYKICVQIRDYNDAIVLLEQLIRLDPDNMEYKRGLKDLYFRTGKTQDAMNLARECGEDMSEPDGDDMTEATQDADNRALISGIRRAISTRKWGDAVRACEAAIGMDPKNMKARTLLAYVEFKRRNTDSVIEVCEQILKDQPDHILAKEYLALSYIKLREWAKAGELLEDVVLLDVDEINSQPFGLKKEEVVANLALTYEKRNLVRTAQMTYEKLLQGNVKFPAVNKRLEKLEVPLARVSVPPPPPRAQARTPSPAPTPLTDPTPTPQPAAEPAEPAPPPREESSQAEQIVAPAQAGSATWSGPTRLCQACDREAPVAGGFCPFCGTEFGVGKRCINCGIGLPLQAMFCPECGQNQAPQRYTCFQCSTSTPSPQKYCRSCGSLLLQACPGAEEIAEYVEKAEELLGQDLKQEAIDQFKKAVMQFPHQAVGMFGLALLHEFIHKTDDSVNQYRKVLEMPGDPLILGEACRRLGILLIFSQRRPSEALEPLERGARLVPDDPSFHYVMGLAYMSIGETSKAMRAFNKIVEFDPRNALAFAGIARIYARGNRGNEAAQYYNNAINLLRLARLLFLEQRTGGDVIDGVLEEE